MPPDFDANIFCTIFVVTGLHTTALQRLSILRVFNSAALISCSEKALSNPARTLISFPRSSRGTKAMSAVDNDRRRVKKAFCCEAKWYYDCTKRKPIRDSENAGKVHFLFDFFYVQLFLIWANFGLKVRKKDKIA